MIRRFYKRTGFTLIEGLVLLTIGCILLFVIGTLIFGVKNAGNYDFIKYANPQLYQAITTEKLANEMARQNDLNQKRLELMERQKENK